VRRFVRKIRVARSRKAYLRVETEPGEQAQIDGASFGQLRIGSTVRPLSCFAMVLSWSRAIFVDFSLDMRLDTSCGCTSAPSRCSAAFRRSASTTTSRA
jgi:transposase